MLNDNLFVTCNIDIDYLLTSRECFLLPMISHSLGQASLSREQLEGNYV